MVVRGWEAGYALTPMSGTLPQSLRGHPTDHAYVGSRKDGSKQIGRMVIVSSQICRPLPLPTHQWEEGWEAGFTGVTGKARSLGFGARGTLGLPFPPSNQPRPPATKLRGWDCPRNSGWLPEGPIADRIAGLGLPPQ